MPCTASCSRDVRTADVSTCGLRSAVIVGSADWQQTDFFIQRSRCCDHNEYSVKILHAVRSVITAIAELLVYFVAVSSSEPCGVRPNRDSLRIIGGHEATPHSWPWQCSLFKEVYDEKTHTSYTGLYCGCSIIAPQWIITAAHCVYV